MPAVNQPLMSVVKQLQLIDERELKQIPPNADPKLLVEKGLLTAYQMKLLLKDQGDDLLLGSYVLLDLLGEGGMGQVFKARHRKLDRIVALKIIRKDRVSTANGVSRFQREAKAAAKLASPHVVAVYDADEVNGIHYMAMEFLDGTDLGSLVKKKGPLSISQACDYIVQAAVGLQHAHEKGLVHRDIKPTNLFLAKTETGDIVKVLDFGLTLVEDEKARKTRLTQIGGVLGTVDYMSPEQATDSRRVDIRSDIYSLGCSLFHLLTGELPFMGKDALARLSARVLDEPRSVKQVRADIPTELEVVMKLMLAREPAQRFQTPAELAIALQPFSQRTTPTTTDADTVFPTRKSRGTSRSRKRLVVAAVVGFLLLTAIGLGAISILKKDQRGPAVASNEPKEQPIPTDNEHSKDKDKDKAKADPPPRPGALVFQDREYRIVLDNINWKDARVAALKLGGDLAVVDTPDKRAFLLPHIKGLQLYVGCFRDDQSRWRWVNGKDVEAHSWAPGRPGGFGPYAHIFGHPWGDGSIGDGSESVPSCKGYVVEWQKAARPQ